MHNSVPPEGYVTRGQVIARGSFPETGSGTIVLRFYRAPPCAISEPEAIM